MYKENRLLKLSAVGGLFFALLGIGWGLMIDSEMIRFDRVYSLVSLLLSLMAIFMCNFMSRSDKKNFPFGKSTISPIVVILKSIVLIIMCSISLISSVKTIISGGNLVDTGYAIVYTIISILGCLAIYAYMKWEGEKLNSDIIRIESGQWLMDALISIGVFIGFVIVLLIQNTRFGYLTKYIDPAMVIISSSVFFKVPIAALLKAFKELILVRANDEINDCITKAVELVEKEYEFEESITRVSKIGSSLRIEIDFIFNDECKIEKLEDMDVIREKINSLINSIKYDKWLNVSFTGNRKWVI